MCLIILITSWPNSQAEIQKAFRGKLNYKITLVTGKYKKG